MKILYKNRSFGGGAPKSLLEYVKIAQKQKFETIVVGQFNYPPKDYYKFNIDVIDIPYFDLSKPFYSFNLLIKYLKIIKREKPNLIHCIAPINSVFHTIVEDVIKVPILYTIPGGKIGEITANMLNGKKIIVFSSENVKELVEYGHNRNDIYKFSNRINFQEIQYLEKKYKMIHQPSRENINFLITSRIVSSKIHSIKHMINTVDKLNRNNLNVILHILGDGNLYDTIKEIAEEVNFNHGKTIIKLHGYKSNIHEYFLNADVVFGKGRSVIDGIIFKKPSFVVDENNNIIECNIENFNNLSDNNFTGRNNNNKVTTYNELEKKISSLTHRNSLQNIEKLYLLTEKKYDISVIEDNILKLYKDNLSTETNYTYNLFKVSYKYIIFYFKVVYYRFFK